jgi:hypothetical protein
MAVVAIGDSNGGGTIAISNGSCIAMDGGTVAQSLYVALQSQWIVVVVMGNGRETFAIDNGGNNAMDGGMAAQLQWAMVVVMGDSGCHNGRQQQRWHDCNGIQWWGRNG